MRFARTDIHAKKPTRKHESDAGLDLYAYTLVTIPPGETKIVPTGIAIELPEGTMGLLKPKSRHDFMVAAGVIDQAYRGEVKVKIFNTTPKTIWFRPGDPVAQLVVVPVLTPEVERVSIKDLTKTKRGKTGGINGNPE